MDEQLEGALLPEKHSAVSMVGGQSVGRLTDDKGTDARQSGNGVLTEGKGGGVSRMGKKGRVTGERSLVAGVKEGGMTRVVTGGKEGNGTGLVAEWNEGSDKGMAVEEKEGGVMGVVAEVKEGGVVTRGEGGGRGGTGAVDGGDESDAEPRTIVTRARSRRNNANVTTDLSDSNPEPDSEATLSNASETSVALTSRRSSSNAVQLTQTLVKNDAGVSRVDQRVIGDDDISTLRDTENNVDSNSTAKRITRSSYRERMMERRLIGKGGRIKSSGSEAMQVQRIISKSKIQKVVTPLKRRNRRTQRRRGTLDSVQSSESSESSGDEATLVKERRRKVTRGKKHQRDNRKRRLQNECFPSSTKKHCRSLTSNPAPCPIGNALAEILSDIPEVDIKPVTLSAANISLLNSCPSPSTNPPTNTQEVTSKDPSPNDPSPNDTNHTQKRLTALPPSKIRLRQTSERKVCEGELVLKPVDQVNSNSNNSMVIAPAQQESLEGDTVLSPSSNKPVPLLNVGKSEPESNHHKCLRLWQDDLALGPKARHGPVLYAMDKLQATLQNKEPWISKAKQIWTIWRHRVPEIERRLYTERAKKNRLKVDKSRRRRPAQKRPALRATRANTIPSSDSNHIKTPTQTNTGSVDKPDKFVHPSSEPAPPPPPHEDSGISAKLALTIQKAKSRSLSPVLKRLRQMQEKKVVDLSSSTVPISSTEVQSFRSRSLSPMSHTIETRNSSWFLSPSSQIGSLCSSQNVMSFLPQSLSPEKIQNTDDSITEKKGGHHQKAFTAASTVKNVSSKVSTSGELSVSERVQPPKVLTPLSRGEKKPLQEKPHSKSGSVAAGVKPSLQNKKPLQEKPPSTSGSAAAGFKISLQNKKPLQEKPPSKSGSVEAGVKPSLLNKKPLQEKPPSSMGGSVAAGIKPSLQNKAAGSQSVSLSRSAGLSTTGTHSNGQTNNNSHTSAKFVAASKNSSKPMRSRKRSPQGLSPLLSSRFPVNAPSFVIPQMPSHDIGTYLPAASGSGSVCSTSLNGKTGVSRVTASSTYFPDLPAAIQQPNSIIGHTPQLSGHTPQLSGNTPQLSGNTPQSSSMIGHTPYSISVMAHSSRSSWIPQSSSTIGHALSVKSSIQKQYQNSTVSKGTSKSVVQSPDGKTRRISVASPPLMTGFGLRRSRSSSTSSSALSSPSPPPAEMCISGEPRVGSVPSMIKRHKSTIHHTGFLDSGEYLSKKHAPIPIFQPKSLRNDSSSILQPSVSPSIVTVMSSSSKPSHSVMPSKPSHSPGSVVSSVAEIGKVTKTSAAHSRKTVAKGSKQSRRTSVSSLKSDTDSFSLPSSFHDPLKPMVVGSPKKYSSEATEITLPSPSHQYSPNRAFVTPYSPGTSSPTGVQSEVLNTRHGTGMGLPFGFPVAHSSGTASPSSVTSSSGTNFAMPTVDLSTMSRWEIEQLYYYNTAILEEQKRLMKLIERHLLETEQENKQTVIRKPSTFEVYKHFLEFLTEPETIPDASISIHGFSEDTEVNDVIVGGTPYQPIINNKYDVYRKFLNKT